MVEKKICLAPWNNLRIQTNGDCYVCTPAFSKIQYKLGNIFINTFDEIWNGKYAKNLRKGIYNLKYGYCRTDLCNISYEKKYINLLKYNEPDRLNVEFSPYPRFIYLCFDYSCLQKCVFCRDNIRMMKQIEGDRYLKVIKEKIFPILKNVERVEVNGEGEFLDSIYCKEIIRNIVKINPEIRFSLISNGVSFTLDNLHKIGLFGKIDEVKISVHSANKDTYKKIFRKDNFDEVMKNIENIAEMKKKNEIKKFEMMFVICSLNYKDMIDFVILCKKYVANPMFSLINKNPVEYTNDLIEYAIFNPMHRNYNDFVRIINIMKEKNMIDKYCVPEYLLNLKSNNIVKVFKNYIDYYLYKIKKTNF